MADFGRRLDELRAAGKASAVCQALEEHLAQGMAGKWEAQVRAAGQRPPARQSVLRRLFGA
jgi:hypothetical protein